MCPSAGRTLNMRQDATFFEGKDARLVYIAKRLSDATELEEAFAGQGIDYGVEPDTYTGGLVFRSERIGAFFYVLPEQEDAARQLIRARGWKPV